MHLKDLSINLPHKPTATLSISALFPGTSHPDFADCPDITSLPPSSTLLVFLNGLILPKSSWNECVGRFLRIREKRRRGSTSSSSSSDTGSGSNATKPKPGTTTGGEHGPASSVKPEQEETATEIPNILLYDRYGQGTSSADPSSPSSPSPSLNPPPTTTPPSPPSPTCTTSSSTSQPPTSPTPSPPST
ncbi:hypothetical protein B0T20DRAFT_511858 [Sordaria brevicollis]|uniref:Uncharacterized protein n=1 Tax=Sordaria brevicollis TaxID=83679 RepID=A0AAE0U0E5_SORBR|nr:hypothetical protein B0T20DRAFT_511858 [Sordaria brevicollis]